MPWEAEGLTRLEKILVFASRMPITKGVLQGEQMVLLDHQVEFLRMIYGTTPQPKLALQSLPRGNGKTGMVAMICTNAILGSEAEPRGEVYSMATTRDQAAITFNEIVAMIEAIPEFSARVAIGRHQKRIEVLEGPGKGSIYQSLAADHSSALGAAPSLWVYDELAAAKDRRLLDALMTASGKRRNALGIIISTQAQTDDHPLSILIDEALAGHAPSTALQLVCAPIEADPFDMEVIKACNPAAGHYLNLSDLEAAADMARRSYAFEPAFRNFRLNQRIRTDADSRIVDAATWNRGNVPVIESNLVGKPCICGFDSAAKHDLVAFLMAFASPEGIVDVVCRFWTPRGQLAGRRPGERELFEQWAKAGYLTVTEGDIVDPAWVLREITVLASRFKIQEIRYDKSYMDWIRLEMQRANVTLPFVEMRQGFISMGPALMALADKLRAGQVRHGGNPILTHCIGNAVVVADAADNMKFHKGRSHSTSKLRVDGAVALAMAMAPGAPPEPAPTFQMMFV